MQLGTRTIRLRGEMSNRDLIRTKFCEVRLFLEPERSNLNSGLIARKKGIVTLNHLSISITSVHLYRPFVSGANRVIVSPSRQSSAGVFKRHTFGTSVTAGMDSSPAGFQGATSRAREGSQFGERDDVGNRPKPCHADGGVAHSRS